MYIRVHLRMSEDELRTTVRLKRTGHDPVEIQKEQVSPTVLARIFSVCW